jgi:hypothetical protein
LGKGEKKSRENALRLTHSLRLRRLIGASGFVRLGQSLRSFPRLTAPRFWAPAKIKAGKNGLPLFLLIRRPKPRKLLTLSDIKTEILKIYWSTALHGSAITLLKYLLRKIIRNVIKIGYKLFIF